MLLVRFDQDKQPILSQKILYMIKGGAHIGRKMQDIRGDNDVKLPGRHALFERIARDVECLNANKRIVAEPLRGAINNRAGDIAEKIIGPLGRQDRKQVRGEAAGSGTELQHAQAAIQRMSIDPFGDSLARYAIIDARGGRAVIQMLDSAPVLRREQVLCIKLPPQQRHDALAGAADQSEFGNIVRMVTQQLSPEKHGLGQWVIHRQGPASGLLLNQPCWLSDVDEPLQIPAMLRLDALHCRQALQGERPFARA